MIGQVGKKTFRRTLDENPDAAVATEAQARVEAHQRGRARPHHLERAMGYFFLQTSTAQRTDRHAIRANEHSRPGPAITRALRLNERGQGERLAAMAFPFPDDVVDLS